MRKTGGTNANESSDTESADHKTSSKPPKMAFKLTFRKSKDAQGKPGDEDGGERQNEEAEEEEKLNERPPAVPPRDDGVVYAELDLENVKGGGPRPLLVKPDDERTEYAEIIHSGKGNK